jgi:hypothetical protein
VLAPTQAEPWRWGITVGTNEIQDVLFQDVCVRRFCACFRRTLHRLLSARLCRINGLKISVSWFALLHQFFCFTSPRDGTLFCTGILAISTWHLVSNLMSRFVALHSGERPFHQMCMSWRQWIRRTQGCSIGAGAEPRLF